MKPEFKTKWHTELYPKWFVRDPNCANQAREPGLFKEEVNISSGGMVSLRNLLKYVNLVIKYISLSDVLKDLVKC